MDCGKEGQVVWMEDAFELFRECCKRNVCVQIPIQLEL